MKRVVFLVLIAALLVLLPLRTMFAEEDGPLHLLWDIPFGISLEETQELFRAKKGIELVFIKNGKQDELALNKSQKVRFLGCDVENFRCIAQDGMLSHIVMELKPVVWTPHAVSNSEVDRYLRLCDLLSSEYGPPHYTCIMVRSDQMGLYSFKSGLPSEAVIIHALQNQRYVHVSADYNNVSLDFTRPYSKNSLEISIWYVQQGNRAFNEEPAYEDVFAMNVDVGF